MALTVGCSGLAGPVRQQAQAVVSADRQDVPIEIVTSTEFTVAAAVQDPTQPPATATVDLVSADTAVQDLPFNKTYNIQTTGRFFIRVQFPATATDSPSVNAAVKVYIDGQQRNSVQGDLSTKPLQAVFLSANG